MTTLREIITGLRIIEDYVENPSIDVSEGCLYVSIRADRLTATDFERLTEMGWKCTETSFYYQ